MKKNLKINIRLDGTSLRLLGNRLARSFRSLPIALFVQYGRLLHMLTVIAIALAAVALIWELLYVDPEGVANLPSSNPKLLTEGIDRLEFWIEEREAVRQKSLDLPARDFLDSGL